MIVWNVPPSAANRPTCSKRSRRGATMMEYLFVLSLIGVACISAVGYFGSETSNLTQGASTAINKSLSPGNNPLPSGGVLPVGALDPTPEEKDTKDKKKDKTTTP